MISNKYQNGLLGVEAIVAIGTLMALISISNLGLRFSDEGYYLQGYLSLQPKGSTLTSFHVIIGRLLGDSATNIQIIRLSRHFLILTATIAFSYSLTQKDSKHFLLIAPFVFMAMANSFVFGPQSLSYNSANQFLLIMLAALLYWYMSQHETKPWPAILFIIATSILLSLILFIKITSLAVLALIIPLVVFSSSNLKRSFSVIFYIGLSTLTLSLLLDTSLNINTLQKIKSYISYSQESQIGHSHSMLINTIKGFILQMKLPLITFLLVFGAFKLSQRFISKLTPILFWSLFLSIPLVICFKYSAIKNTYPYLFFIAAWTGYLFAIAPFPLHKKKENIKLIVLLITLILFPVAGAFGSDTGILRNSLMYSVFWFVIPIPLFGAVDLSKLKLKIYTTSAIIILAVFTFKGVWSNPYRKENLKNTNTLIVNPHQPKNKIYINQDQTKRLKILNTELRNHGYQKGDFIFGMGHNIGNIFFLEGIIPGGMPFSTKNLPFYFFSNSLANNDFKKSFFILDNWEYEQTKDIFNYYGYFFQTYHQEILIPAINTRLFVPNKLY
jgi:hypothetical protein